MNEEEQERLGAIMLELFAVLVAMLDEHRTDDVRALVFELISVEEAGRISATRMKRSIEPLALASVQLARARGVCGAEAVADAVRPAAERAITSRLVGRAMRAAIADLFDLYEDRRPGGSL